MIRTPPYDNRFNTIGFEDLASEDCRKDRLLNVLEANLDPSSYVTLNQIQEHFGKITRYQVNQYLRQVGAEPIGQLPNVDESGKRSRGVAKIVYSVSVIEEIQSLTTATINVEEIKRKAMEILEEG